MILTRYHVLALFILATAIIIGASNGMSAEDEWNINLSQGFAWDSNPLNNINTNNDIYGLETRAGIIYDRVWNNFEWGTDFTILNDHFDDSDFNSTDFYFDTDFKWSTPTSELQLTGGYDFDTTRDETNTALGPNINAERRESWVIAPRYRHRITERFMFNLNADWEETRYDDDGLTDFRTISATPSISYNISPIQLVSLGLQTRRFEPLDIAGREVESYGPTIGWNYNFHPKFTLALTGGYLGTSFKGYPGIDEDREFDPIYSASLNYKGLKNNASLIFSRARQAFADGTDADQTSIQLDNSNQLNDRLTLNFGALYQTVEQGVALTSTGFESAIAQSLSLNYKLGNRWSMSLTQNYRQEQYENLAGEAERNIIQLGLTYNFNDVY